VVDHTKIPMFSKKYGVRVAKPEEEVREKEGVLEEVDNEYVEEYYHLVEKVLDSLKIPEEKRAQFVRDHDFSQGSLTLEFAVPAPPPSHTWDENPIIKAIDEH